MPEPTEAEAKKPGKRARVTRGEAADKKGEDRYMPDIADEVTYLIDTLFEAGPATNTGMGPIPLTWDDLAAWSRGPGAPLAPWEQITLRRLSSAFLAEMERATDHAALPPWIASEPISQEAKAAISLRDSIRQIKALKN